MGYNTTILFLNDSADAIRRNPEQVVENILDAMRNTSEASVDYAVGNHANPMQSLATAHADEYRLYLSHGNCLMELGYRSNVKSLELRKRNLKEAKWLLKREEGEIRRLEKEAK